jgi:outer membrane protein
VRDIRGARSIRRGVLSALLLLGLLLPLPASAEPLPPAVVAVIDYQRVMRDAQAARSVREQVEERRRTYQDEIAQKEQQLHEVDKELARQRSLLTPEAFAERRREFEQEVAEVQRLVQERRRQLDEASARAMSHLRDELIEVVSELAEEHGFNLVLPSSQVLVYAPALDLTREVLGALDRRVPDIRLAGPGN